MSKQALRNKKAISEMIATIILIGIAIVAGAFVYTYFFGRVNSIGNTAAVEIESANIVNSQLIITIKNTGTYTFSSIATPALYSGGSAVSISSGSFSSSTLSPGMTTSGVFSFSETAGNTYTIIVTATYSGGTTSSTVSVIGS